MDRDRKSVWVLAHPTYWFLVHVTSIVGKLSPRTALGWVVLVGGGFQEEFSTDFSSVSLWGCQTHKDRGKKKFQVQIPNYDTPYWVYRSPVAEFQFKIASIFKNFNFQANLAKKSNSYVFEMISGFFSSIQVDSNSTLQFLRIHYNFSLEPILGQEVASETLSPGPVKPKFSKCSVSNQILREGYLWIVWVFYGILFSRNTPQSYLCMTQVNFMLFHRLWV